MKNINKILFGAVAILAFSSCTITQPYAVTDHPIGSKTGVSKTNVILGVIQMNKDYGVADAAKQGKIKGPISTVDLKISNYILFSTKELIVTGDEN